MDTETTTECAELSEYSPPIALARSHLPQWTSATRLSLFESKALPENGGIAFAGGRISALKWHPQVKGVLAAAAHRSDQPVHEVLKLYRGRGHIQLWFVDNNLATCMGVVPHNGDCTWDLKWRPTTNEAESTNEQGGTFAAALGDGTILVCQFNDISRNSNGCNAESGRMCVLPCSQKILRANVRGSPPKPVRVVEWSLDGNRLLVGCVTGAVEVFESSSSESMWAKWSVPAQESIVADIRWVNRYLFCSLGTSCVLRLRDIRDPIATIEQNAEGLAGSLSMCMVEPNVVVVGGDTGYLRVVRLCGTDNFKAKYPVRRVYIQGNSFRTMQSVSAPYEGTSRSLVFTGGCEGVLHEVIFPRPIWHGNEQCSISKTKVEQLLSWDVEDSLEGRDDTGAALLLTIGATIAVRVPDNVEGNEGHAADEAQNSFPPGQKRKHQQRTRKISGPSGDDKPLFGTTYRQSVCITRVDVSLCDRRIAVGIDGGIITWLQLEHEFLESSLVRTIPPPTKKRKRATSKSMSQRLKTTQKPVNNKEK
ncbi:WD40/YVTN repeat-like containing protein [Gracilaria domingensis]|nr:WD40/YVTN repeat-like containing protein [Gracilaria domingensis]